MRPRPPSNFDFLGHHDPRLAVLGAEAEQLFAEFPAPCVTTLRVFGEVLAQRAAARVGVLIEPRATQAELLARLAERGALPFAPRQLFHALRTSGNAAAHGGGADHREALHQLKQARELAIWFQRAFGNNARFDPGPFVPPPDPAGEDAALSRALEAMRDELAKSQVDLDAVRAAVEDEAKRRLSAEERAAQLAEERALWESLAVDADAALAAVQAKHAAELAALQAAAVAAPPAAVDAVVALAAGAGERVELDEAATRRLIDAELRAAGWEVDSETLTEANGARPQKGLHRAIAEWRVAAEGAKSASDRADYVLFVGLEAVAVVEAKRKKKDVSQS
ncbi:MAG TPA: type I restriction-modification system endonuclease, partial [Byssovorax sp.]